MEISACLIINMSGKKAVLLNYIQYFNLILHSDFGQLIWKDSGKKNNPTKESAIAFLAIYISPPYKNV